MKTVLAAVLALFSALAFAGSDIEIVYLGTDDCPYCRYWEAARKPELLASPEGRVARYHEVRGRTLREPIRESHYPAELKWVYDQVGPSRGVPRFLLAVRGRVVLNVAGTEAYRQAFLPALRAAVAERAAGTIARASEVK